MDMSTGQNQGMAPTPSSSKAPSKPKNYKSVVALTTGELHSWCRQFNMTINMPKKAKQNIVCFALGIGTDSKEGTSCLMSPHLPNHGMTPEQLTEYKSITPDNLCRLQGWSKDFSRIPCIDDAMVKMYLTGTQVFTQDLSVKYKISRPYALMDHVHNMSIHVNPTSSPSPTFIAIQSRVNPSQSTSPDEVKAVFVIMDALTGQPYGGYCSCTVG